MSSKKVFISSTCYDLPDVRAEISSLLTQHRYEPIYNESGNFPKKHNLNSHDMCIEAVKDCDYYILIIDKRYGGKYNGNLLKNQGDKSVTWCEADMAFHLKIPVFTFVRNDIWTERKTYKYNLLNGESIKTAHVDNSKIFEFIDDIVHKDKNNWIEPFENSVEIKNKLLSWIKEIDTGNRVFKTYSKYDSVSKKHHNFLKKYLLEKNIIKKVEVEFSIEERKFSEKPFSKERQIRIAENIHLAYKPKTVLSNSIEIRVETDLLPLIQKLIDIETIIRMENFVPFTNKRIGIMRKKIHAIINHRWKNIILNAYEDSIEHVIYNCHHLPDYKEEELQKERDYYLSIQPTGLIKIVDELLTKSLVDSQISTQLK